MANTSSSCPAAPVRGNTRSVTTECVISVENFCDGTETPSPKAQRAALHQQHMNSCWSMHAHANPRKTHAEKNGRRSMRCQTMRVWDQHSAWKGPRQNSGKTSVRQPAILPVQPGYFPPLQNRTDHLDSHHTMRTLNIVLRTSVIYRKLSYSVPQPVKGQSSSQYSSSPGPSKPEAQNLASAI